MLLQLICQLLKLLRWLRLETRQTKSHAHKLCWHLFSPPPRTKVKVTRWDRFVCHSVCVQHYCTSNETISLKLNVTIALPIGRNGQRLVVMQSWTWIPDHFSTSLTTAEQGILWDLWAFLIQPPADFHDTQQTDWCWQGNESTTYWMWSGRHLDPYPD